MATSLLINIARRQLKVLHVQTPAMTMMSFSVRRREPELIGPAAPTPHETKRLSDVDDQEALRVQVPFVHFYRAGGLAAAGVIRRALGDALVPYYPLAGRLREVEGRKLVVECTGEGVLLVEADADVRLAELEDAAGGSGLRPPFPSMDQLLFDVEGSAGVLDSPLLLVQVTGLLCGGFVFAVRVNHTMCDAIGISNFLLAVGELARGLPAPTVHPAWCRELLEARSPPEPSFPHREFDAVPPPPPPPGDLVTRTFAFTAADVAAIRDGLPPRLRDTATTFEALTAFLWRARTAALELPDGELARLVVIANLRGIAELNLPAGYYGNACIAPTAIITAEALLRRGSLGDAVDMVRAAKAAVTAEYARSTADMLVLRGRPLMAVANVFAVSDQRHAGFHRLDLGWGEPVYGGAVNVLFGLAHLVAVKNGDGESAAGVLVSLPPAAMERFASQMAVTKLPGGE